MENQEINRVVLAIDVSNFLYCTMWAAVSEWRQEDIDDYNMWVKPLKDTDQENLPDITKSAVFVKILKRETANKLERTIWLAQNRNIDEFGTAEGIDIFFVEDSDISNGFRKKLFPQYKAQRRLVKKLVDVGAVKKYIRYVIMPTLDIENSLRCRFVKIDNCESDDIIAVIMKVCHGYKHRIIMSSDKDFLQLENVKQYDMFGKRIERRIKKVEHELTPREFLIWKILRGDVSDNIRNVFFKCGEVRSYKLSKDTTKLNKMLTENQDAANRFILNKKLIDFRSIPSDMIETIENVVREKLNELHEYDKIDEFSLESCIEI